MAQIDFNTFKMQGSNNQRVERPKVGFFFLKDDQEEAVVRFLLDSPQDFDIVASHRMRVGEKDRPINCLRNPKDPIEKCPACAAGIKVQYKLYMRLIQYVRTETGEIAALPKVWERTTVYVDTFLNLLNEYGALSDCFFKIKRNGKAGSKDTRYDIMFLNPANYPESKYPKIADAFTGYTAAGNIVWNKSFEDMQAMIKPQGNTVDTPAFTEELKKQEAADIFSDYPLKDDGAVNEVPASVPAASEPASNVGRPQPRYNSGSNAQNPFARPARFY